MERGGEACDNWAPLLLPRAPDDLWREVPAIDWGFADSAKRGAAGLRKRDHFSRAEPSRGIVLTRFPLGIIPPKRGAGPVFHPVHLSPISKLAVLALSNLAYCNSLKYDSMYSLDR